MLVLKSLTRLCPMSSLCPQYVQPMSRLCPCPIYDQYLPSISNFCPWQIQYLSFWSNICPQFALLCNQNWWKICKTRSSQTLDMTNHAFTTWSPCKRTKLGQSLDSGKSEVCPPFVHESFSVQNVSVWQYSLLGQILDKYQTHVQLMSSLCQPLPSPLRQTVEKAWTNVGKLWPISALACSASTNLLFSIRWPS